MSKHTKALQKLQSKPTPSDMKWDELVSLLKHLGYVLVNRGGSRRRFYHKGKDVLINCHEPHPSPDVDKGCLVQIVEHLKINEII